MAAHDVSSPAAAFAGPAAADGPVTITLTSLASAVRLDDALATDLWEHLELNPELDAEMAANIPALDLNASINDFVEKRGLAAGTAGRIYTIFAKLERHRASIDDPPPQTAAPPTVAVVAVAPGGKLSAVLDQNDDRTYAALSLEARIQLRANHLAATGGPPPVGKDPSSDQLAAMMARLERNEPPYADFAIFQPHGRRLVKFHKFDAQIFVQGTLQSQRLKGPSSFPAWQNCWAVFRATMISLSEVSPATLDGYERGLAQLVSLHPTQWGIVYCADEILRSEVWQKVQEGMQDLGTWPAVRPWDQVIKLTTYGGPESTYEMQHWWSTHVLFPCQSARSPLAFLHGIEGTDLLPMPGGMTVSTATASTGAASSHDRPQNNSQKAGNNKKKNNKAHSAPYHDHNHGKDKGKGKGGKSKHQEGKGKHGGKSSKK